MTIIFNSTLILYGKLGLAMHGHAMHGRLVRPVMFNAFPSHGSSAHWQIGPRVELFVSELFFCQLTKSGIMVDKVTRMVAIGRAWVEESSATP